MKIRTVILDDDTAIISIISSTVEQVFRARGVESEVEMFSSAKKCFEWLGKNHADLLLLDINMPEIDGVKFGQNVRNKLAGKSPDIVFISGNEERVFDVFELSAFGFVRKDNYLDDISRVLARYIDVRVVKKSTSQVFEVKDSRGVSVFDARDIVYLESFRNNQSVHLRDGSSVTLHSTMATLEKKLCTSNNLIRIHKSYIVNCEFIGSFGRVEVILKSKDKVPVGRVYYVDGVEKYMNWIKLRGVRTIKN